MAALAAVQATKPTPSTAVAISRAFCQAGTMVRMVLPLVRPLTYQVRLRT